MQQFGLLRKRTWSVSRNNVECIFLHFVIVIFWSPGDIENCLSTHYFTVEGSLMVVDTWSAGRRWQLQSFEFFNISFNKFISNYVYCIFFVVWGSEMPTRYWTRLWIIWNQMVVRRVGQRIAIQPGNLWKWEWQMARTRANRLLFVIEFMELDNIGTWILSAGCQLQDIFRWNMYWYCNFITSYLIKIGYQLVWETELGFKILTRQSRWTISDLYVGWEGGINKVSLIKKREGQETSRDAT